jgi:hypothetical protein
MMTTLPLAALDLLRMLDPERVGAIEGIKHRAILREVRVRATLEEEATWLEGVQDPTRFDPIEARAERELEAAAHDAECELQSIVQAGDERFREAFARGRARLGVEWPLASVIAASAAAPAQAA